MDYLRGSWGRVVGNNEATLRIEFVYSRTVVLEADCGGVTGVRGSFVFRGIWFGEVRLGYFEDRP